MSGDAPSLSGGARSRHAPGAPIDLSPWRLRAGSAVAAALGAAAALTPMAAQASDAEASVAPADSGASTPPSILSDEGFTHLVGQRLRLALVDGEPVMGLLTAVEPGQVSFACEPDDDVVEIATSRIIGVGLLAPASAARRNERVARAAGRRHALTDAVVDRFRDDDGGRDRAVCVRIGALGR
ncbi:MAG: hypothetical protein H6700_01040 [Myxococcales bacterium]|nr:hypothetical protein [Myxococcales bacterium]